MDEKDQIKDRIDIAEFIGEYIDLKKAGSNFKGACPFHNEKTPSFMVSPDKQIWHCFGCNKGGDVFTFLMEKEGMEFPEALRALAKRAGVEIKPRNPKIWSKKNKLYEISNLASKYFHQVFLKSQEGKIARDYISKRKFSSEILEKFQVGYSADAWDILSKFLRTKGYSDEDIFAAGLSVQNKKGGYYDRFRGRLMFPIKNLHGDVIAFGGRTLRDEDAKYINTQETEIYSKSWVMYGLYEARGEIRQKDLAIIVEGYTDVMASHQAGVTNVVASSGTALTEEHLKLLKRYTKNIALAFDMDLAGDMATKRGIELALSQGFNVSIVRLPEGKDPGELAISDKQAWENSIKTPQPIMDFFFDRAFANRDVKNVEHKKEISRDLLPVIKKIDHDIEQFHFLEKLANKLSVPTEILQQALRKINLPRETTKVKSKVANKSPETDLLAKRFLGLALKLPDEMEYILDNFDKDYLESEDLRELYTSLETYYNTNRSYTAKQFQQDLTKENEIQGNLVPELLLYVEKDLVEADQDMLGQELKICLNLLRKSFLKNKLQSTSDLLAQAEREGKVNEIEDISTEFTRLTSELRETEKQLNRE